jgi:hypothetical protein
MSDSQRDINVRIRAANETQAAFQQATQGTRAFKAEVDQTTVQVGAYRDRMRELKAQHDLGQISATQYTRGLKTLRADMAELAATTTLSARAQRDLGQVSASAESQIVGLGRGTRRTKDGVEALAISAVGLTQAARGNIGALAGVFSQLQLVFLSNPWLVGVLGGLSAIAMAYQVIAGSAAEAKTAATDVASQFGGLRVDGPALTDAQRQARVREEIAMRERALRGMPRDRQPTAREVRTPEGRVTIPALSAEDAAYNEHFRFMRAMLSAELVQLRDIETSNRTNLGLIRAQEAAKAAARVRPVGLTDAQARQAEEWRQRELQAAAEKPESFRDLVPMDPIREMPIIGQLQNVRAELKETGAEYMRYGGYVTAVMEAGAVAAVEHQNVVTAMLRATMQAIAKEMQVRAGVEVAEAAVDAAHLRWGEAAMHMRAAAMLAVAGGVAGALGSSSSAGRSSPAGNSGSSASAPQTVVIQILGQTTGQVVQETTYDLARYQALGGRAPGTSVVHLPVSGVVVVGAG